MEGEPIRDRAPLLADATFRCWLSSSPPSSEDEPVSDWPWLETGWAPATVLRFEFFVLCHLPLVHTGRESCSLESDPPGLRAPPRKRLDVRTLRVGTAVLLDGRCAAGVAAGFECPWRSWQAVGLDTLIFLSPGTAQLVEGAALIRR